MSVTLNHFCNVVESAVYFAQIDGSLFHSSASRTDNARSIVESVKIKNYREQGIDFQQRNMY